MLSIISILGLVIFGIAAAAAMLGFAYGLLKTFVGIVRG